MVCVWIKPKVLISRSGLEDLRRIGIGESRGRGPQAEAMARKLQGELPDRVRVETRYDLSSLRQIMAAQIFAHAIERYEPCGISR